MSHRSPPPSVADWLARVARTLADAERLVLFALVGAAGMLCDNVVLAAFVELGGYGDGLALVAAGAVAKEASILLMFALNERYTFDPAAHDARWRRLLTSNVVRLGGLVVGLAALYGLTELGLHYLVANVVGIGLGFAVNYTAESLVTWRVLDRH